MSDSGVGVLSWAREEDPFPVFARLRTENPVHWEPTLRSWIVTRYDDVGKVLRSADLYSSDRLRPYFESLSDERRSPLPDLSRFIAQWLVFQGPPVHPRLRAIMNPPLLPTAVARLRPGIERLVDQLIDGFIDKGRVEFIAEFALLLPGYVMCDLLGIPRADLAQIRIWSDELNLFIGNARDTPDKYIRAEAGTHAMVDYFRRVIAEKRSRPGDDVISTLVGIREEAGRLSEEELVSICILLIFGGHETTTNLLGNGMLAFIRNPDQQRKLRDRPALATSAVEECLRYDGPGGAVVRIVNVDHELGGKSLRKGDRVFAMVPPANRDPAHFRDPDRFDIERGDNSHLTFGQGAHFCMGAPLARLEATVAFPRLLQRMKNIRVETDNLSWRDATVMRGVLALPLSFERIA